MSAFDQVTNLHSSTFTNLLENPAKIVDEGYNSLEAANDTPSTLKSPNLLSAVKRGEFDPIHLGSGLLGSSSNEVEFSKMVNIDDEDEEYDEVIAPISEGLTKWKAFQNIVNEIQPDEVHPNQQRKFKSFKPTIKEKLAKFMTGDKRMNLNTPPTLLDIEETISEEPTNKKKKSSINQNPILIKRSSSTGKLFLKSQPIISKLLSGKEKLSGVLHRNKVKDSDNDSGSSSKTLNSQYSEHQISEDAPDFTTQEEILLAQVNQKLFDCKYRTLSKQLGTGGHSTVKLGQRIQDNAYVVCKHMKQQSVWHWQYDPETNRKIPLEIILMRKFSQMNIPGVIKYYEHFEMAGKYIIIMEYLGEEWVDLYDYIELHGPVNEEHTREIFQSVVSIIQKLHSLGYCHNDIKDENILINVNTRQVKLIDFGSMTPLYPGKMNTLFYGTKKFAAPEAIMGDPYYPESQEVWGLGTLLYVLLFKMDPFKGDDEIVNLDIGKRMQRLKMSKNGVIISDEAKELIEAMLEKDSRRRISLAAITRFPFFTKYTNGRGTWEYD